MGVAWLNGDVRWMIGGVLLIVNWPYTLIVILPLNNKLMTIAPESAGDETRAVLDHWSALHAGRTALGALAAVVLSWAALS